MPSRKLSVTPYVFGAVLNSDQLRTLAELKCGAKLIERCQGYHATALNHYCHDQGIQECFLLFGEPGSDDDLYLWVQGVVPSFNGTKPKFDLPCLDHKYPEMKSIGYIGLKGFEWPSFLARTFARAYSLGLR
jgi:hypothetical protein